MNEFGSIYQCIEDRINDDVAAWRQQYNRGSGENCEKIHVRILPFKIITNLSHFIAFCFILKVKKIQKSVDSLRYGSPIKTFSMLMAASMK